MKSHPIIAFLFIWTLHHRPLSLASAQGGIVGGSDVNPSTICGDDNRVPSFDLRQGRLVTPGLGTCTAWLISEDVFLTAGHCGVPDEEWRVHFTFGADDAPEEDQYAIETELDVNPASYGATFIPRLGLDWAAGRLKPNDITGKLPGVAQSEKCGTMGCGWYSLGPVPSQASGNSITITGYGSNVDNSVPQKTSTGALVGITQVKLFYATDSMGGNSGGPILHFQTGKAIGIHTNGGCGVTGGANSGTRIDVPELMAHISFLLNTSSPTGRPTTKRPTAKPSAKRPTLRPTRRYTSKPTPTS